MTSFIAFIDGLTTHLGRITRWLALVMVILICIVVLLRYGADIPLIATLNQNYISMIALQELAQYSHGTLFMLGAVYTLQQNEHVRVDIFYRTWSLERQNKVNRIGITLLLIPTCSFIFVSSWEFVLNSWHIGEQSQDIGGLAFVYVFKSLLLIMPVLMLLQAAAELFKTFRPQNTHEA